MTDTTNKKPKSPSHVAYHVREREGGDSIWTPIGAAWPHADGKGFTIQTNLMPVDGRITLRVKEEKVKDAQV